MSVIFVRVLIIFITLVVIMRLMGKRQIGEMQPFEFIITLIVADLACIPMADVTIPLAYGIVAILALFIFHQLLSLLEQSHPFFKLVISGKPSIVINKDGVDFKELKRNNLGVDDLIESMRSLGYFSLDDLDYAIFESNGKLSALEKKDFASKKTSVPLIMIDNGKPVNKNLELTGINESKLMKFLSEQNAKLKKTEIMTVDGGGRVYLKTSGEKYKILTLPLAEDRKW